MRCACIGLLQVRQFRDRKRHQPATACVPVPKHDRQQAQQRQHAAGQREEEELDRRVAPLFASPDADEEEQRHERELEEQVEENNVAGDEHAEHARAQHQQQTVVQRLLVLDRFPTYQHGDDQQQGREREEPEAQAVQGDAEADVQRNARSGEPRVIDGREGRIADAELATSTIAPTSVASEPARAQQRACVRPRPARIAAAAGSSRVTSNRIFMRRLIVSGTSECRWQRHTECA